MIFVYNRLSNLRRLHITVEFTSVDLITSVYKETPDDDNDDDDDDDAYSSKHVEV